MGLLDSIAATPDRPLLEDLEDARHEVQADLTQDEYALARMIASEDFSGSPVTLLCLGDAQCNRSADEGRGIFDSVTRGNGFGPQGKNPSRPVATSRPPAPRHVRAALALLRRPRFVGLTLPFPPPARGMSRGARLFLSPRAQLALNRERGSGHSCPPLAVLRKWTYGLDIVGRQNNDCQLSERPGSRTQMEWVGPIPGVDAYRQMFLRPATARQDELYADAVKVIETEGRYQGQGVSSVGLLALAVVGLVAFKELA